jgi:predicted nucleotidyltransferase
MAFSFSYDFRGSEKNAYPLATPLDDSFLHSLASELDNDDIVGIMLGGSYVRGEATPYSDVDLACFMKEDVPPPPKRFFYREDRLISVANKTVAGMRADLLRPERAILFVSGGRRVLLDKDGSVTRLIHDMEAFRWEPLQEAADQFASFQIMILAERVHKILSELLKDDDLALALAVSEFLHYLTELVAVQRGVLIKSESTYYRQVQATVGVDTDWTRYHRCVIGVSIDGQSAVSGLNLRDRAVAALRLYQETVKLLQSILQSTHLSVAQGTVQIISTVV